MDADGDRSKLPSQETRIRNFFLAQMEADATVTSGFLRPPTPFYSDPIQGAYALFNATNPKRAIGRNTGVSHSGESCTSFRSCLSPKAQFPSYRPVPSLSLAGPLS